MKKLLGKINIPPLLLVFLVLWALFFLFRFLEHPGELNREIRKILFFAIGIILILLIQGIRITGWMFRNRYLLSAGIITIVILALFVFLHSKAGQESIWPFLLAGLGFSSVFVGMAINNIRRERKLIRATPYAADEPGSYTGPLTLMSPDGERVIEGRILLLSTRLVLLPDHGPGREIPFDQLKNVKVINKHLIVKWLNIELNSREQYTLSVPFPKFWHYQLTSRK
ncbi:MAG: hypothetical protein R6V75_11615 [Bacteroidales bacterium]